MNVNATTEALQTDNASLGGVVEGRQVEEAPQNGRNVMNLLDFIPGVTRWMTASSPVTSKFSTLTVSTHVILF